MPTTILAPVPRQAIHPHDTVSSYPFQVSPMELDASRRVAKVDNLLSPIHLIDPRAGNPRFKSQSPVPCTPPRRRRGTAPRRRRTCARTDCRIDPHSTAVAFDRLPWISMMESAPEHTNTWDMADLSQLSTEELDNAQGPGPVRRRKTSSGLRANPLTTGPSPSDELPRLRMPLLDALRASELSSPHTPVSHSFNPMDVQFHNLLPVFSPPNRHNDDD
ncbi:hypothetical protein HWV62_33363 [Athelia sp. TMB]|nr:hypothetical protein HWV62_33363 [Athelia sp. TMB]